MKVKLALVFVLISCLLFTFATAEVNSDYLGIWYRTTYEDLANYPGHVFQAEDPSEYVEVLTDGDNYVMIKYNECGMQDKAVYHCDNENNCPSIGSLTKFILEDDTLVETFQDGESTFVTKYSRTAPHWSERNLSKYTSLNSIDEVDGTWVISEYGLKRAYIDADSLNLSGTATFDHGVLTLNWTMDGVEKNAVITFDSELNEGRLYTVLNGSTSYIVTKQSSNCLILNISLNQVQWVFTKAAE